jgi:hypothetical protein
MTEKNLAAHRANSSHSLGMEDSDRRQLWRLTNVLFRVRSGALTLRDVKNEGRPDYVHENKWNDDKMSGYRDGFLQENAEIARQLTTIASTC